MLSKVIQPSNDFPFKFKKPLIAQKKSNKKLIGRLSMTKDTNTLKFFIKRFTTYIIHYTQT
jgi:hypothetical protein